jgi:predicted ATPase
MSSRDVSRSTFGELLRQHRLASALSQEALAERAQLSQDAIRSLESGRRRSPRPATVALLADALALSPAERAALIAAAADEAPPAPADAPEAPDAPTPPYRPSATLPYLPSALIGREREEAAVTHLLRQSGVRLLTLTGPGGVGKTRLALAIARAIQGAYADGAVFVDLSPLRDPALVSAALARALDLPEANAQSTQDLLMAYLREKETLLVLDNVEQVAPAARFVADLVAVCPNLTVMATSRVALRVRAEQQFPVPPLDTPGPESLPREDLQHYAAVQLFLARARAIQADFALSDTNIAPIAEICRRLDGLPLAIELAAARIRLLPPAALLSRLERRLPLLTGGARDLPDRQRTLRAAIAWSYDLLTQDEQALFRRLGVFVGAATLAAIEAICAPEADASTERGWDVMEEVTALVEHSLLHSNQSGGEPRVGMLETLREYAVEQLAASGEMEMLQRSHALYYLGMAEQAQAALSGPDKAAWLGRLEREHDNLRAALEWVQQRGEREIGLRLGAALWRYWQIHGHIREGNERLERLLSVADTDGNHAVLAARAQALIGAGWLAHSLDRFEQASARFEESAALQRDASGITNLLANNAMEARAMGDYRRATALLEECLALCRAHGDRTSIGGGGLGLSLARLALVLGEQGDDDRATALWQECLDLHQELGDRGGIAAALLGLSDIARNRGDSQQTRRFGTESLALFRELGEQWAIGFALNNLALASYSDGDLAGANTLSAEAVEVFRQVGTGSALAEGLATVGRVARAHGDLEEAQRSLVEALRLARDSGPRWLIAATLEQLAALDVARGRPERATRLLGAAAALRQAMGTPVTGSAGAEHDAAMANVRAALGDELFAAAWAAGEQSPLEHLLEEAVALSPGEQRSPATPGTASDASGHAIGDGGPQG